MNEIYEDRKKFQDLWLLPDSFPFFKAPINGGMESSIPASHLPIPLIQQNQIFDLVAT